MSLSRTQVVGEEDWIINGTGNIWTTGLFGILPNRSDDPRTLNGLHTTIDPANPTADTLERRLQAGVRYVFRGNTSGDIYGDTWVPGITARRDVDVEAGFQTGTTFDNGTTLSHTYTRFGILNGIDNGTGSRRPFYSEVELGLFQDLGHTVDIRGQFGRSLYMENAGAVAVTNNRNFGANWNGTTYATTPNTNRFGIGLHIVGDRYNVTQAANLLADGEAGAGIRIEGTNNSVTINPGVLITANGLNGCGVLVTHGTGAYVNNRGTIQAIGTNGVAVYLNSGTWSDRTVAGGNAAHEIANGSARQFDNTGTIRATWGTDAIRFEGGIGDPIVNLMTGTTVIGNITSNSFGNGTITYGKTANTTTGVATNAGNNTFSYTYAGDIVGVNLQTWGGDTTLTGTNLRFGTGNISSGAGAIASTLFLPNVAGFTSLNIGSAANAFGTLDGQTSGRVTVNGDVNNYGTAKNLLLLDTGAWGDLTNNAGANIVDNTTINVGSRLANAGLIDRFTNLSVGTRLNNAATGIINVGGGSKMTVGGDGANGGLITMNGESTFGSTFTNNFSGTVNGTGKFTTNTGFNNFGIISPGNGSIGTMTIAGQFVNGPTGQLNIDVDPTIHFNDLIKVVDNPFTLAADGIATINGGFVNVNAPGNDKTKVATPFRYVGGTKYTFLTAENGLVVNTELVANNPADMVVFDFVAEDNYDANKYWLEIERAYIYGPFGDTENQVSVGNYLDEIGQDPDPNGDFFDVLVKLDELNVGIAHRKGISQAAKWAEDQMSGAIYGTLAHSSITNTTIVNNTLNDVLRLDSLGVEVCDPCNPCEPGYKVLPRWHAWGLGYGTGGSTQFDGNAYGYTQSFGGMLVGVDRAANECLRMGFYTAYGEGQISSDLQERSKSKELLMGLYLKQDMQTGYFLANAGLGLNTYNTERTISFMNRTAKNQHDAIVGTVYVERGLEIQGEQSKLQPFFGLQYACNQQATFTETGANSLNLVGDITNGNSFRSLFGGRMSTNDNPAMNRPISLYGQAVWMHEFLGQTRSSFTGQFSNPGLSNFSSTAKYTVQGNDPGRDWALIGTGITLDNSQWRFFAGYDLAMNTQQVLHTGNAGFMKGW